MAASNHARYWTRAKTFAVAGLLCLALIVLLKEVGPGLSAGGAIRLSLLAVLCWLCGVYCTHRCWQAFKDDEIARGGSASTAREKWRLLHPPAD